MLKLKKYKKQIEGKKEKLQQESIIFEQKQKNLYGRVPIINSRKLDPKSRINERRNTTNNNKKLKQNKKILSTRNEEISESFFK